jgi:hypothetical protein
MLIELEYQNGHQSSYDGINVSHFGQGVGQPSFPAL